MLLYSVELHQVRLKFHASKIGLSCPSPKVFLLTVPMRFLCCSSLCVCGRAAVCDCGTPWTFLYLFCCFLRGVCFVLICSSALLLLVPQKGCASWLWHFLGTFTYIYYQSDTLMVGKHVTVKHLYTDTRYNKKHRFNDSMIMWLVQKVTVNQI